MARSSHRRSPNRHNNNRPVKPKQKNSDKPVSPVQVFALAIEIAVIIVIGLAAGRFIFLPFLINGASGNPNPDAPVGQVSDNDQADLSLNCGDFKTQKAAQYVLDINPADPFALDGDNNKLACESLPKGDRDANKLDLNCTDFETKKAAQFVLDQEQNDRFGLDRDNDGIACDSLK
jgi:hypothetical protein